MSQQIRLRLSDEAAALLSEAAAADGERDAASRIVSQALVQLLSPAAEPSPAVAHGQLQRLLEMVEHHMRAQGTWPAAPGVAQAVPAAPGLQDLQTYYGPNWITEPEEAPAATNGHLGKPGVWKRLFLKG